MVDTCQAATLFNQVHQSHLFRADLVVMFQKKFSLAKTLVLLCLLELYVDIHSIFTAYARSSFLAVIPVDVSQWTEIGINHLDFSLMLLTL